MSQLRRLDLACGERRPRGEERAAPELWRPFRVAPRALLALVLLALLRFGLRPDLAVVRARVPVELRVVFALRLAVERRLGFDLALGSRLLRREDAC